MGLLAAALATALAPSALAQAGGCERTLTADVVALDQQFWWNRLGAFQPQGMIFALRRDVVDSDANPGDGVLTPGQVNLRTDKRPRPIVLRMNVGDCLEIHFQNLLDPVPRDAQQPATRTTSLKVVGMQLVNSIADAGANVGVDFAAANGGDNTVGAAVDPGGTATYTFYAQAENTFSLNSGGALTGGEGNGGSINSGLFGAVNVQPRGSKWYRSQVTEEDLALAADPLNGGGGYTADGHPIVNYEARYPLGHQYEGKPILEILDGTEIVHTDLTAIVADIPAGTYPSNPTYPDREQPFREFTIIYHDEIGAVQAFPIFEDPAMAYTLHGVRDAFAINYGTGGIGAEIVANRLGVGPMWDCTECKYEEFFLTSWVVGDPAMVVDLPANMTDPKNPDPAQQTRATEAFYPDDPSNVYHSYLRDHVKMRLSHGGSKEHHIHHLHAHQWLHTPDSQSSAYLDSQAFGPGSAFTLEMVYNGSGNRNQTVGDSIFHCHFYPHFAMGMWALWRVHDVFEDGSRRLPDGEIVQGTPIPGLVPLPGLPMAPMPAAQVDIVAQDLNGDGVADSSQAVVGALPGVELGNPGFPFFIPGTAGHRPPHPPLDTYVDENGVAHDGGLPRHHVVGDAGNTAISVETPFDFTKEILTMKAVQVPEEGTELEQVAMAFHAIREHPTFLPDGTPGASFIANGLPAVAGAPYAEPCMDDDGDPLGVLPDADGDGIGEPARVYKAANIQIDAVLNKSGWHFPQMRIITLWGDVDDTFAGTRAPEPFFFRANSGECVEYLHTNLVPNVYELDDFQVRTPTDILGQHIHLVKFDVTSSDGSGNGWNYEDGTFSPDEVRERIHALNAFDPVNGGFVTTGGTTALLEPQPHPYFGHGPALPEGAIGSEFEGAGWFTGAQTTVQRWMADDVLDNNGNDRTLRTVFTHDHYGPSTHQQAGLYAGLVVEPAGSTWRDPATGDVYGQGLATAYTGPGGSGGMVTTDGGPTSWRADVIAGPNGADSYREFMLELADFQLAYEAGSHPDLPSAGGPVFPDPWHGVARDPAVAGEEGFTALPFAVNPPGKKELPLPLVIEAPAFPRPEAISVDDPGAMSFNYRTEPIPLRVQADDGSQAPGLAGDLSHVFRSDVVRADPGLNKPPSEWPYPGSTASAGAQTGDPITPILRAYEDDRIQIRTLVGAHEEGHNLGIHGVKWMFEPSWNDSGWRSSQIMGISEHFEYIAPAGTVKNPLPGEEVAFNDFLYKPGSSTDDLWSGMWGLFRVYNAEQAGILPDLLPLPNNPDGVTPPIKNKSKWRGVCPVDAPIRTFDISAVRAADVLPGGQLTYNSRAGADGMGALVDPTAILFVMTDDLRLIRDKGEVVGAELNAGVPIEPLVLRANAGDCIEVELWNHVTPQIDSDGDGVADRLTDLPGWSTLPMVVEHFNANQVAPSAEVGLHAQLLHYAVGEGGDGTNAGFNLVQTAQPQPFVRPRDRDKSKRAEYQWYAGNVTVEPDGNRVATPIEFGAINLSSSDPIKHASKGAIAALVIEPQGSTWVTDPGTRAAATVTCPDDPSTDDVVEGEFREFVVVIQSDVNMRRDGVAGDAAAVANLADAEDPEDSGQKAINYRSEPFWFRMGFDADTPLTATRSIEFNGNGNVGVLNNDRVGGDPETPVFTVEAGSQVRFRVLKPGGNQRNHVFAVDGHGWSRLPHRHAEGAYAMPYEESLGSTRIGENGLSHWEGSSQGIGPGSHVNCVLTHGAGGLFGVPGDYLYRDLVGFHIDGGLWGILRVLPKNQ